MTKNPSVVLKNVRVLPDQVSNDGKAGVQVDVMAFTPVDDASIHRVVIDLSSLTGEPEHPLTFQKVDGIQRTREGLYTGSFRVPLLADPGPYTLPLLASDSEGTLGSANAGFRVEYRRPPYSGTLLSKKNQSILDRISGVERVGGNRIEALVNGNTAMEKRMSLIRKARKQINLEVYSLSAEGRCGRFVDALLEKASQGVEVNLLLNMSSQLAVSPFTALRMGLDKIGRDIQGLVKRLDESLEGRRGVLDTLKEIQESFQGLGQGRHGVNVILVGDDAILGAEKTREPSGRRSQRWFDKMAQDRKHLDRKDLGLLQERRMSLRGNLGLPSLPLLTYAIHEKIMVVDGTWAVVGGRNLEDRYFTHWVDMDLYLEGPVVRNVQNGFLRSWKSFSRNSKQVSVPTPVFGEGSGAGNLGARFVQSRPWTGEYSTMETLVTAFQMAKERICISSQYLVLPESLLREALLDAAKRGVAVHILTNSHTTGQEVGFSAGHFITLRYCKPLMDAGVRIYEMIGPSEEEMPKPYLHAKMFLLDGVWAAIGSFNLSMRSCFIESENLVVVQGAEFVREQEEVFWERVNKHATLLTRESLKEQKEKFRAPMAVAGYLDLFF